MSPGFHQGYLKMTLSCCSRMPPMNDTHHSVWNTKFARYFPLTARGQNEKNILQFKGQDAFIKLICCVIDTFNLTLPLLTLHTCAHVNVPCTDLMWQKCPHSIKSVCQVKRAVDGSGPLVLLSRLSNFLLSRLSNLDKTVILLQQAKCNSLTQQHSEIDHHKVMARDSTRISFWKDFCGQLYTRPLACPQLHNHSYADPITEFCGQQSFHRSFP